MYLVHTEALYHTNSSYSSLTRKSTPCEELSGRISPYQGKGSKTQRKNAAVALERYRRDVSIRRRLALCARTLPSGKRTKKNSSAAIISRRCDILHVMRYHTPGTTAACAKYRPSTNPFESDIKISKYLYLWYVDT